MNFITAQVSGDDYFLLTCILFVMCL